MKGITKLINKPTPPCTKLVHLLWVGLAPWGRDAGGVGPRSTAGDEYSINAQEGLAMGPFAVIWVAWKMQRLGDTANSSTVKPWELMATVSHGQNPRAEGMPGSLLP